MQSLLASLVVSMSVKDSTFRSAMASNRAEVKKTGQDFDRSADQMDGAMKRAAQSVNDATVRIVDGLAKIGDAVTRQGLLLTAGLSLPLGLLGKTAKDTAADFETAMNLVQSAMVSASPDQIDKLREAALRLGPAFGKSAIDAAGAIEALAKAGMDSSAILGGGLESAMKLSVVGQAELTDSAAATTDVMKQFNLTTGQLPGVVDRVTGALDASKMNFDDYRLAIGQMGGVAGGLGYTFDDMNTGLAATASYFQSGSDAGTSFKTFLTTLNPASKEAERVMEQLGIKTKDTGNAFFQANGQAKSLGDIAEVLRQRMGKLSDRSLQDALTTMFGTDAMRTAIALMKEGSAGIADMQRQIESVTAQQKLDILLDGEAAATQRLASAWEKLKIVVGEAGIIQAFTMVKEAAASMLGVLGSAPPWFYTLAVVAGAAAASIGPLTLAAVGLAKIALPLLLLRLGPVALGMAAIINPAGVLIRLLGELALRAGGAALIGRLGTALIGFAGPIGLAVTGLSLLIPAVMRMGVVSEAYADAQAKLNEDQARGREITTQLATATGKAREETLAAAKALRVHRIEALADAKAMLINAQASYRKQRDFETSGANSTVLGQVVGLVTGRNRTGSARDLVTANATYNSRMAGLGELDAAIAAAQAGGGAKVDMNFGGDPKTTTTRTPKGRDTSADAADYAAKLADVRNAQLQAMADLTGSFEARYRADMDGLAADRSTYVRQLATDDALDATNRAILLAEKDREIETRKAVIEQTRSIAKAQEGYDLFAAVNDAQQDLARVSVDLADSGETRKVAELRLLDLQREREVADLDLILATKATASAEWANAEKRKTALDGIYAQRADAIGRANEGPAGNYMRFLNRSTSAIGEDVDAGAVDALKGLNTGLTDALMGTAKLADAFENMGKRIISSLLDIAIQQAIIRPLANSLFGVADAAGNRSGGSLGGVGSFLTRTFGGGRAAGGAIDPSNWYVVGEKGPELFAPGISGTVIPNGGRGNRPGAGGAMQVVPSPYFDVIVDGRVVRGAAPIAQATTAAGLQQASRAQSWQGRQTLR